VHRCLRTEVEMHVREAYLVIIRELHPSLYVLLGIDDNVLVTLHCYDLCVAVGVTAVINEASQPTLHHERSLRRATMSPCRGGQAQGVNFAFKG